MTESQNMLDEELEIMFDIIRFKDVKRRLFKHLVRGFLFAADEKEHRDVLVAGNEEFFTQLDRDFAEAIRLSSDDCNANLKSPKYPLVGLCRDNKLTQLIEALGMDDTELEGHLQIELDKHQCKAADVESDLSCNNLHNDL